MRLKKKFESKVVEKAVLGSFLDIRIVHKSEGHGKQKRTTSSTYGIYNAKILAKDGFKTTSDAKEFIKNNLTKYDKKTKKFK